MHINRSEISVSANRHDMPVKGFFVSVGLLLMVLGVGSTARADYQIGPDDILQIRVYGYDDLDSEPKVSASGRITFPLIGELMVSGLTTFDLEQKIARLLSDGSFIQNPNVTVGVLENQGQLVSVLGQVNKPGRYPLQTSSTLVDLIAMAGGINDKGDERVIVTSRVDGALTKKEINLRGLLESSEANPSFTVVKGDVVYIPRAPVFYIYGEVQKPGAYRVEPDLSVAQAISLGGGITPHGTLRGIEIERKNKTGHPETIDAELIDRVYQDDVVFVDERLF